jgi:hypothetical protein
MKNDEENPALCPACGEPFGDYAFEVNNEMVCEGCFRAWYEDMSNKELAAALGVRVVFRG